MKETTRVNNDQTKYYLESFIQPLYSLFLLTLSFSTSCALSPSYRFIILKIKLTVATDMASKYNGFISWLFVRFSILQFVFYKYLNIKKKKVNFETIKILDKDIAYVLSIPREKVKHL